MSWCAILSIFWRRSEGKEMVFRIKKMCHVTHCWLSESFLGPASQKSP
jgi:hypothetical protein